MKLHEHFISAQFSAVPRRRAILREHSTAVAWIQRLSDVGIVLACFYVLAWLRNGSFSQRYQLFAIVAGLLMLVMYEWLGTYRQLRMGGILQEAQVLFKAWTGVMLALALIGFISK